MRTNRRIRRLLLLLSLAPLILIPALTRIRLPSSPKRHPHTRPLPQTPQPFPASQPRPTYIPSPILIATATAAALAALRAIKTANDAIRSTRYSLAFQISMGEFLATPEPTPDSSAADEDLNNRGFRSINSKRSDFLIYTRPDFLPALVIEYHGPGHYQGNALARDAVKRAALKRAGIPLLETDCIDPVRLYRQISEKLATLPRPAAT